MIKYFYGSFGVTFAGMILAGFVGYEYSQTLTGIWEAIFLALVLSILEVSISFDNAVVNASVLKDMTPKWQHRFLTWGMVIAVFGMRLVFPLVIVSLAAHVGPWEALLIAAQKPDEYARIMTGAHVPVAAFGGAFLFMVGLKYFFDSAKEIHWIGLIERPLVFLGKMEAVEAAIVLAAIYFFSQYLPETEQLRFIEAGIFGLITYVAVDGLGAFLEVPEKGMRDLEKASAVSFLYLEVLDASFSFDGVIGAFAITHNLFIIAIGLGVGAMFVRSLTIMMVDKGSLNEFRYLEHGAFYAILALAVIMFAGTIAHIPEWITGLIGASFIGFSIWASIKFNKDEKEAREI